MVHRHSFQKRQVSFNAQTLVAVLLAVGGGGSGGFTTTTTTTTILTPVVSFSATELRLCGPPFQALRRPLPDTRRFSSTQQPRSASAPLAETETRETARVVDVDVDADAEAAPVVRSPPMQKWLDRGLLLSSFSDGLGSNAPAIDWLMASLVETLWKEEQANVQAALKESNLASPCNGPDPVLLGQLEDTDRVVEGSGSDGDGDGDGDHHHHHNWKTQLELLCQTKSARNPQKEPIDLRVLYIPTAMYALRPGSTSKPGKQRGRNRADGKSRRNDLVGLLEGQLRGCFVETGNGNDYGTFFDDDDDNAGFRLRTVTLDFDDASVKQPEEVVIGNDSGSTSGDRFPESGKEAIRGWKPHLIYVQGGNTFWLHHCMEKGDWAEDLMDACSYPFGDDNDDDSFPAVYCGVSAGAILAGESMQTACWKEWDDPSVVPGKETYGDWTDSKGLDAAGRTSLFPHMTEEWRELTERKTLELLDSVGGAGEERRPSVRCIRDDQAYAVDGRTKSIVEL